MTPPLDLVKLAAMRDAHARLHADYKSTAARARDAQTDASRLRQLIVTGSPERQAAATQILHMPVAEMLAQTADTLQRVGLDRRTIQRIADAQHRADALRKEAEALAPKLRKSGLLITRLNEQTLHLEQSQ